MLNRRRFIAALAAHSALGGCVAGGQPPRPVRPRLPIRPPLPILPPQPLSPQASISAWRKRIETILDHGALPIIDTEATYGSKIDVPFILREMEHYDISQIAFAPNYGSGDTKSSLNLHRMYPAYFNSDHERRHKAGVVRQGSFSARGFLQNRYRRSAKQGVLFHGRTRNSALPFE